MQTNKNVIHKEEKIGIFAALAASLALLASCSGDYTPESRYKTGDLPDGVYKLNEDVSRIYPYDNKNRKNHGS